MSEEELRQEAVRRRLSGESPTEIAEALGRTTRWVRKWVGRHSEEAGSESWAESRSGLLPGGADLAAGAQEVHVGSEHWASWPASVAPMPGPPSASGYDVRSRAFNCTASRRIVASTNPRRQRSVQS